MIGLPARASCCAAALALGLSLAPATARAQSVTGSWESEAQDGRIQLQLRVEQSDDGVWMSGFTVEPVELEGLDSTAGARDARGVTFRLMREAGTISLSGDIIGGRGSGTFIFSPSDAYVRDLAALGFTEIPERRLLLFATLDMTTDYVRGLRQLGYASLDQEDLVRFVIHGVSPDFIREMNALGYAAIQPGQLVKLRIHGVSPDYVRRMRAALNS